ncbi:hypothetical protein LWC34_56075 [Kibdelosporangium philippinense]|uniref:Uncharacterized protein n=1 Tax=Kibdelosporangium philippinense TaxID=211113 RepID=A0ABS8ZXF7_9PSEU|nr:hypothetical protein [Kibdelosporangium philippinense]MCE7012073.1 hypothetical protein [Kibdelosporangium philippinense]
MTDEAAPETKSIRRLPTAPCSVVWSRGHAYVLEAGLARSRWVGCDDRGRPVEYTNAEIERRGWTLTRAS